MLLNPESKYSSFPVVKKVNRSWPNRILNKAPRWCSTDLRDGNQALANPMDKVKKAEYFQCLVDIGFKEIEVAFPAASNIDYDFVRYLIEKNQIPDDVTIQVITQAKTELIDKTMSALLGAKQAIVHVYNATAPIFREQVFQMSKEEVVNLAVQAVNQIKDFCHKHPETSWTLEYSPETFCMTELEFSIDICQKIIDVWQPCEQYPLILNLPATVEVNTPNVYADQIESMVEALNVDENICISIHPHNDRGTGVAAAELAQLAGATRVEGCLFGNGERTGNVDLVTLALNLYSQGIYPNLDFSNMKHIVMMAEKMTDLSIHPRHPYAGELVFTAFSGSHQDAIKKGFQWRQHHGLTNWSVPYLPLDPKDIGSSYEAVIRVNSQSGKSGGAWILQKNHGLILPRYLQKDFSQYVQEYTDVVGREITVSEIWTLFKKRYGLKSQPNISIKDFQFDAETGVIHANLLQSNQIIFVTGKGNGLISAWINALSGFIDHEITVVNYDEHSLGNSTESQAVAYIGCQISNFQIFYGVAIEKDISKAALQAILNGLLSVFPQLKLEPIGQH